MSIQFYVIAKIIFAFKDEQGKKIPGLVLAEYFRMGKKEDR